jgi:hypothetical protein
VVRARPVAGAVVALTLVGVAALLSYVAWDDSRAHQQAAQATYRGDELARQLRASQDQTDRLDEQVSSLRTDNTRLQGDARNPTLIMWNSCGGPCTISPGAVRVGSVPDTFQLQIDFTADVPVHAYVFTFHQWTQFDNCGFSTRCVAGKFQAFEAATSMHQVFDEAEGCSGYVWVLQSDRGGTIRPNVKVRYLPAAQPTGICAANP